MDFLCIFVHLVTLLLFVKVWKWKVFAHPGFYFSGIWLVSVISEYYLLSVGKAILIDQALIDELNIYSAFTSFCFLLFVGLGKGKKSIDFRINIVRSKEVFLKYLYLCLALVVFNFILKGASFSFGRNRLAYTGNMAHVMNDASAIDSIISILTSPTIYFTIFMGVEIARYFMENSQLHFSKKALALPFLMTFLNALMIGGRNPIAISVKHYLFGIGMGLSTYFLHGKQKKKIVRFVLIIFIGFSLFSTLVAEGRRQVFGFSTVVVENESKLMSTFSGVMDYMSAHYWGYQLRRNDFSSGNDLKYGICTFYGLGNLSIPFFFFFGLEGNVWKWLGVDYNPQEVYLSGVEGFYTTSTIYALLVRDFGVNGTYFAIFFLVIITQFIFVRALKKEHRTALSLIPIIMVFTYWSSSNFNSGFPSLQPLLFGALLFDLTQNNYSRKRYAIKRNYYPDQICNQARTLG